MTEHGVTVELRGPDGRAQPIGPRARAERVRATHVARMRAARTLLERLAVADDFAAGAATAAGRGGVDITADIEHATRVLWAAGESLTRQLADTEARDG